MSLGRRLGEENKLIIWYCGSKVVVQVARDKGEVANGAVGKTSEGRMPSTLLFGAWVALSLAVGRASGRSTLPCLSLPPAPASPRATSLLGFVVL